MNKTIQIFDNEFIGNGGTTFPRISAVLYVDIELMVVKVQYKDTYSKSWNVKVEQEKIEKIIANCFKNKALSFIGKE